MTDDAASGEAPLHVDPHAVGVWATDVEVVVGTYEVTLDFVRVDHVSGRRYLAARVAVPADLTLDLTARIDQAQALWKRHTGRVT